MTNLDGEKSQDRNLMGRLIPGLLISALAIFILSRFVDAGELVRAFTLLDYRLLPWVILMFMGTISARAKAWRTILEERATLKDSFLVLNQGYLLNNILPFRLGEVGRGLLLAERTGLGFWRVISSVVIERVFDVGFAAILLLGALPFVIAADWLRSVTQAALVLVFLGFALIIVLAIYPEAVIRILQRLLQPWPKLQSWILDKINSFLEGLEPLKNINRLLQITFWMTLTWVFNVAWYFFLLRAFFPDAEWLWAIFVVGVGSVGVAIPSSPAYIGVLEGAIVAALSLFGLEPSLALAFALVAHALYFVLTGLLGSIGFAQQGQSIGKVYQRLVSRSSSAETNH
jgi:hypothetical protein